MEPRVKQRRNDLINVILCTSVIEVAPLVVWSTPTRLSATVAGLPASVRRAGPHAAGRNPAYTGY